METLYSQTLFASRYFHPYIERFRPASTVDGVALIFFILVTFGYLTRGQLWEKPDPHYALYFERPQQLDGGFSTTQPSRNIAQRLEEGNYQAVIFWGSQSGTSERFAEAIARECLAHFGLLALVADASDYDAETISLIPKAKFAIFILSTYGEGDPSDNTAGLWEWIKTVKEKNLRLDSLRYIALGLGNSNYKHYNRVVDVVADAFDVAGATPLIPRRKADDAQGGTEEDFLAWKDGMFDLFKMMGYEEQSADYRATMDVTFSVSAAISEENQFGILSHYQQSSTCSAIVPLVVKNSRELFTAGERNCVHMELDLANHPSIHYKTGDHVGVWPVNPEDEIDRLLDALGLQERRCETVIITPSKENTRFKIPSPTTLETVFRHYLEICAPVPRKVLVDLAQFAPDAASKAMVMEIGRDRQRYAQLISNTHITLARLLQIVSPLESWISLPLSFVLECLRPMQPRYYSISSSSVISPRKVAVTALVVNKTAAGPPESIIYGLTSNYILSAGRIPSNSAHRIPRYQHINIAESAGSNKVLAHIRKSKFKLPITCSTPLILVSAGTGLAPFRAFIAERAKLHVVGKPTGRILLFFGCRDAESDFIYKGEIEKAKEGLGDMLEIFTAFSRAGKQKVYVQDRVAEHSGRVLEVLEAGANFYVCGKASMAREVDMRIEEAAKLSKGLSDQEVKAWIDGLKKRGKWKVEVWG
ncbi:cytochrome P450 reductase 2 [Lindgomyces ingoldianus]|uniref:Cytochrome P450 reductase 2 n=1 Tax=Lindgomyces ingoldianus TaxID=673940 RepID=A0ACB6R9P3_9PLEO|nr:cytochrome P450 reductase 2 [Lindgomyces ingoldianus]KAF2475055.1 cytochrome P450 reductase 2 [Lindgomyces ingoldianus]